VPTAVVKSIDPDAVMGSAASDFFWSCGTACRFNRYDERCKYSDEAEFSLIPEEIKMLTRYFSVEVTCAELGSFHLVSTLHAQGQGRPPAAQVGCPTLPVTLLPSVQLSPGRSLTELAQ
jgi:hypothetical protein